MEKTKKEYLDEAGARRGAELRMAHLEASQKALEMDIAAREESFRVEFLAATEVQRLEAEGDFRRSPVHAPPMGPYFK